MNKDSTDFMLTEYERISTAYFGLQAQVTDWFKSYLTLIGFPLTVLAASLRFGTGDISGSLTNLPDVVAALLVALSVLGFFVTVSIITMRMEMILYARTINGVRRFFGVKDKKMAGFLILPTSDILPPFFEAWHSMFWQIVLMGLIDGMLTGIGVNNLFRANWWESLLCVVLSTLLHLTVYYLFAWKSENDWGKPKFPGSLPGSNPHI